ncbi:MAG: YCF48-related protein [candidate division WOR-3 bacterium]
MKTALLLCGVLVAAYGIEGEIYHGVAVAPDGMNAWVVTIETTAVYHTTDFGANWQPQTIGTFRDFFDVCFLDELNGWTCGRVGDIWHTSDGGENWARQNLGGPKFATRIRFLDMQYGWSSGGEAILLHTTNGGEEWDMTFFPRPPYPSDTVDFQGVRFVTRETGWLVAGRFPEGGDTFAFGQGYITKTTDGCATWTLQRVDTVYDFYDVAASDEQTAWVVGGNDRTMAGVVLHTSDGGTTWLEQSLPGGTRFLRSVTFVGDHGWACGRNGTIIHTSDRGTSWVLQSTAVDTTLFDIEFADTLRGMAAGNSVVLFTTDGGRTWVRGLGGVGENPDFRSCIAGSRLAQLQVEPSVTQAGAVSLKVRRVPGSGMQDARLRVFDALGRCVLTRGLAIVDYGSDTTLDCSALPGGTYLVRIDTRAGSSTTGFVLLAGNR